MTLAQTLGLTRSSPGLLPPAAGRHVLSGAFYATRLYHDLREKAGLVYTVEAFLSADKTRSTFVVFYACDPQNVSRARALVEHDLRQMQTTPVSAEELRQAKTLLLRQIPLSRSSYDGIAGEYLSLLRARPPPGRACPGRHDAIGSSPPDRCRRPLPSGSGRRISSR